jgi:hypothetical protein
VNERQCEQTVFYLEMLAEIRDLLHARLPVPVEASEVERLRKENADLRAELAALKAAATATPEVFKQPQDKPGRWVLFDAKAITRKYYDRHGWHDRSLDCIAPWATREDADDYRCYEWETINLDDHKETP